MTRFRGLSVLAGFFFGGVQRSSELLFHELRDLKSNEKTLLDTPLETHRELEYVLQVP